MWLRRFLFVLGLGTMTFAPRAAEAFCGFYVSGADAKLYNNATVVVMMREGTRTVLSMQNNYQGPTEDFALVIPVPIVLQKENVKTLPRELFDKVDQLAAPRLVEYWEQDPCSPNTPLWKEGGGPRRLVIVTSNEIKLGVKVEAQFVVGEYEIVILSANDSVGLDKWLRQQKYKIPEGAEPFLRPYVQGGMKFFVAKVNPAKVKFENGSAMLSPLRFHYDAETFNLPVRLGLVNSAGTQDLLVHIIAKDQRYEVANYPNTSIPTNIDVAEGVSRGFGAFYAALFDKTLEKNPGAVVTEYAWPVGSCDPCPGPVANGLRGDDLMSLGADALPSKDASAGNYVLTRLHARYLKDALGEDLVFRAAPPIIGGNEVRDASGKLDHGSKPNQWNSFQGRYAIRHPWKGNVECPNPIRGVWGPPPGQTRVEAKPAADIAFAPRGGVNLVSLLKEDVPALGIAIPGGPSDAPIFSEPDPTAKPSPVATGSAKPPPPPPAAGGCAACAVMPSRPDDEPNAFTKDAFAALSAIAATLFAGLRRSRRRR